MVPTVDPVDPFFTDFDKGRNTFRKMVVFEFKMVFGMSYLPKVIRLKESA